MLRITNPRLDYAGLQIQRDKVVERFCRMDLLYIQSLEKAQRYVTAGERSEPAVECAPYLSGFEEVEQNA